MPCEVYVLYTGWLFKKLYSRLPLESDKALMLDPDLNQEYRFDVNFIGAANVHYITVRLLEICRRHFDHICMQGWFNFAHS